MTRPAAGVRRQAIAPAPIPGPGAVPDRPSVRDVDGDRDVDWDRTVFVLLGPDAVARHLSATALDRLDDLGYRPIAWRVIWHRPVDVDTFHERDIAYAWRAYRYRLIDQLYAFGPMIALLAHDERPTDIETSHQRLRRAKGSSDPAGAGTGTIRGDLGSINAMLALMHCSDSAAEARQESAVFAGGTGLTIGADPGELRTLDALLRRSGTPERRGYVDVLSGVRGRVLAATWDDLTSPARRTVGAMLSGGGASLAAPGAGERLADLLPAGHPLVGVLRGDFTPGAPGPDLGRARPLLHLHGIDLDRWEDLVLATSQRFWPRGVARPA